MTQRVLALLIFLVTACGQFAHAQSSSATNSYTLQTNSSEGATGRTVEVTLSRSTEGSECGVSLDYGDGETKELRFKANETQITDSHSYSKAGGYKIAMEGKLQFQGFNTAFPCTGATREAIIYVKDDTFSQAAARSAAEQTSQNNTGRSPSVITGAQRVALVIGNSAYTSGRLTNPVNDARAMAAKLKTLGFSVQLKENLKTRDMGAVYREFRSSITPGSVALVFYAGHGVQFKGQNYFPAVDADISGEEDVPLQSLNLGTLLDNMEEAKAGVSLVLLDACRDNPFARRFRTGSRGLAKVEAASGTLIHYATKPGSVASDGDGKNGTYTEALLAQMDAPGVPIELMLKEVTNQVVGKTKGKQEPWVEGSLRGNFFFIAPGANVTFQISPTPVAATVAPIAPISPLAQAPSPFATDAETQFWNEVKSSGSRGYFEAYLKQYPRGKYLALARLELKKLDEQERAQRAQEEAERQQAAVQLRDAQARDEQSKWSRAKSIDTFQSYAEYLDAFPNGRFKTLAEVSKVRLQTQLPNVANTNRAPVDFDFPGSDGSNMRLIARVNGKAVSEARVVALKQQVIRSGRSVTAEMESQLRDEVIAREIFMQAAQIKGLETSAAFKSQLELARQSILIRELFAEYQKKSTSADEAVTKKMTIAYQESLRRGAKVDVIPQARNSDLVAMVNGKAVPKSRLDALAQQAERSGRLVTPEMQDQLRDEVIAREIFVQEAQARGIDATDESKSQIALARQSIMIREMSADYEKRNLVTDEEAKAEYNKVSASNTGKEYKAHHILVEKEAEAKAIIAQLKKGAKFEAIATKSSKDPGSGAKGGNLDWANPSSYVQEFAQALIKLDKGITTETPVKSKLGYHIIRLDDVRDAQLPKFQDVKAKIVQQLQQQKLVKFQEELRSNAKVE